MGARVSLLDWSTADRDATPELALPDLLAHMQGLAQLVEALVLALPPDQYNEECVRGLLSDCGVMLQQLAGRAQALLEPTPETEAAA